MKSRMLVTVVALLALLSHECLLGASNDSPKLTVRLTPLVHLSRGDARAVVMVPRHADNRTLRVILESEDYYALSEVTLEGEDAPVSHLFYWRDLPPGSYQVSVQVYGASGLRDSTSVGDMHALSTQR